MLTNNVKMKVGLLFAVFLCFVTIGCGVNMTKLKTQAEQGNPDAQYRLGLIYLDGKYENIQKIDKKFATSLLVYYRADRSLRDEKAYELFYLSAEKGGTKATEQLLAGGNNNNGYANYYLGAMYYNMKEYVKALEHYKKASGSISTYKDADAKYKIGMIFYNGEGIEQDRKMAFEWFRKSHMTNHSVEASSGAVKSNPSLSILYRAANMEGNPDAQYNLGLCYLGDHNYEGAFEVLKKASVKGHIESQYELGMLYRSGKGIENNYAEAQKWLKKAAGQGNKEAQEVLNRDKEEENARAELRASGLIYFKQQLELARRGYPDAQMYVGMTYYSGKIPASYGPFGGYVDIMKPNKAEGLRWLRLAASAGQQNAINWLYLINSGKSPF
ncbi:MAG: sel1 repeat family protein [Elusimicrobiota bacterium]|jgi:TPR repeat protein|nr:sel1 repeat family protein [Elusimicrobiota bacterium]